MRIVGTGARAIDSLEGWRRLAAPASGDAQWVEGRSAQESARAWLRARDVGVPPALATLVDSRPETAGMRVALVRPEARIRLGDERGNTRNADILAFGIGPGGRTLMTVEAKADETFGPTVSEALNNPRLPVKSRLPERVRRLARLLFAEETDIGALRYQLIHGLAATVLEAERCAAEQAVFAIHEFRGQKTSDTRLRRNSDDFDAFLHALGAEPPAPGNLTLIRLQQYAPPVFIGRAVTPLSYGVD